MTSVMVARAPSPTGAGEPSGQRPEPAELTGVVRRNIRALVAVREEQERRRSAQEAVADRITGFTGSMAFVCLHLALFGGWILVNTGVVPGVTPFDPFPFVMLAMIASVEAIFLSTFVLISQNRMQRVAEKRADLDLQINLLAEHEITRLIGLCDAMADRLGVRPPEPAGLEELKKDVAPEDVLAELARVDGGKPRGRSGGPA